MPYVFRQGDLPKLDLQIDRGTDFKAWKQQWEAYFSLSGLENQTAAKQVQALTLCFSRETVTIVDNLGMSAEQRGNVASIITAIAAYVQGQVNETVERRNFRTRVQQEGESFDDFLVSLRELAKTCNFCTDDCTQKNIRDQIIAGLIDGDTVEDLLKVKTLNLEDTVSKCRAHEAAKRQRAQMKDLPEASIQAVRKPTPPVPKNPNPTPANRSCPGCGSAYHAGGRKQCPAFQVACHNCNRTGHFAKVCRSKPRSPDDTPLKEKGAKALHLSPQEVRRLDMDAAPTIQAHLSTLNGSATLTALPDSGADISVAGPNTLSLLHEHADNLLLSTITPRTVSGHHMRPLGKLPITITVGNHSSKEELHIFPEVEGILLSWKVCKVLNILPACYPNPIATPVIQAVHQPSGTASEDLIQEFSSVFDDQVTAMEGELFRIELTDDATPFCVKTPRAIPFAYRDKLKAKLENLESQGIISPVTHPTAWCAPIVVAPKKDTDDIRMCVDLSHLNRFVKRERYHSSTPAQAVADITAAKAKVFTKMDARKGYHQCPLDPESQDLTTFITPFGRYKYLRAPYGISSISEHYNRRMDEAFEGLPGFRRVVDDIVVYDEDSAQHTEHVRQFLQRCADKRITLNKSKWKFAQPSVDFAGFTLSADGYHIDPSITKAISSFPSPSNRTELRSFIGLVNQLSASTSTVAPLLTPLRPLLSSKNEFVWSEEFESAFQRVKALLTSPPTLAYFDQAKPTRLCTDASRQGIGFVLQQKTGDNWSLIQAGSRFLNDAESRYAIIELELLAVSWAIVKCHLFLAGLQHFTVITDHHPLVPILNTHRLDEIENPRLQRLKTKIMGYNFRAEWVKGSLNNAPDALSRSPNSDPQPFDMLAESEIDNTDAMTAAEIRAISSSLPTPIRLQGLEGEAEQDPEYQKLKHHIIHGFPQHRSQLPTECRRYWNIRTQLTIENNLILFGCRLLIPSQMRRKTLTQLHDSHQGITRTKDRARLIVYWPGMDNDIDNVVGSCKICQDVLPSHHPEPLISKPRPERPFQELAADFCSYAGKQYLVVVDCFTDWPDIIPMGTNTTTTHLTSALRNSFCRTGVPDRLWTDQGPQFTSKLFTDFTKQWGIEHLTSSPRYPQSNGKAEATVKSMKKLLRAAWNGRSLDENKLVKSLLQYRNTPSRKDSLSPAQKLYGRPVQDTLPAHRRAFSSEWQRSAEEVEKKALTSLQNQQSFYDQHARPLPDLQLGSKVAIQNSETKHWDIYGTIIHIGPNRRYFVKTHSGRVLVRNRRFIRKRLALSIPQQHSQQPTIETRTPDEHQTPPDPTPLRRSTRIRQKPQRLVEEMNTFRFQATPQRVMEAPMGGEV